MDQGRDSRVKMKRKADDGEERRAAADRIETTEREREIALSCSCTITRVGAVEINCRRAVRFDVLAFARRAPPARRRPKKWREAIGARLSSQ